MLLNRTGPSSTTWKEGGGGGLCHKNTRSLFSARKSLVDSPDRYISYFLETKKNLNPVLPSEVIDNNLVK